MARKSGYDPKYCDEIIKFFDIEPRRLVTKKCITKRDGETIEEFIEVGNDPKFLSEFARSIGVSQQTLHNWAEKHEEFFEALKKAKELQLEHIVKNALTGSFQQVFSIFTLKNISDWRDRKEVDFTGDMKFEGDMDVNDKFKNFAEKVIKEMGNDS